MSREWKVGDRFTMEGTVEHADNGHVTVAVGPRKMTYGFHHVDFEGAKLIQAAAPEPPKLDVTKPIRTQHSEIRLQYLTTDSHGQVWVKTPVGNVVHFAESQLENIPEPKRTTTQIVELVNFTSGPQIVMKGCGTFYVNVASSAKVTYTEGEGWSICEEES